MTPENTTVAESTFRRLRRSRIVHFAIAGLEPGRPGEAFVMRRSEKRSTRMASNRPIEEWSNVLREGPLRRRDPRPMSPSRHDRHDEGTGLPTEGPRNREPRFGSVRTMAGLANRSGYGTCAHEGATSAGGSARGPIRPKRDPTVGAHSTFRSQALARAPRSVFNFTSLGGLI